VSDIFELVAPKPRPEQHNRKEELDAEQRRVLAVANRWADLMKTCPYCGSDNLATWAWRGFYRFVPIVDCADCTKRIR
jgi:transposase-like protein